MNACATWFERKGQKVLLAASLPALAKNARTGHPRCWNGREKPGKLGHPPKVKLGDYEGSVKAGVEVSSKDGVTAQASAEVSAGPLKAGLSLDKRGVHTDVGAEKNIDIKLGAHIQGGLGVGLNINFSQAGRAYDQSVESVHTLGQYLLNKFMPSGSLF